MWSVACVVKGKHWKNSVDFLSLITIILRIIVTCFYHHRHVVVIIVNSFYSCERFITGTYTFQSFAIVILMLPLMFTIFPLFFAFHACDFGNTLIFQKLHI